MSEWQATTLGKTGKVITGKTPSKDNPEDWGEQVLFVTPSDYKHYGKKANFSQRRLSNIGADRQGQRLLPSNSVLVTCIGSDMGKVVINSLPCVSNQQINAIIPDKLVADGDFLYYVTKDLYETFRNLGSDGTAIPILNKSDFENIGIVLPPLTEQKAIASVLSSLDDKIDLIHRQNATLEAMAETLFRQKFVVEAEENWEEVLITDLFEVRDGTHDSPKQTKTGKPLITSKHIFNGYLDFGNAYLISEDDFNQVNQRSKVDTGDILFSMIGTIGLLYWEQSLSIDYVIKNIGLFKTSQNPDWSVYTYLWLKSPTGRQFIDEHKSGSTQEYVALGSLRSIPFKKPPMVVLRDFNKLALGYFSKINLNHRQIKSLEKLRENLLPKLISGEVRVKL